MKTNLYFKALVTLTLAFAAFTVQAAQTSYYIYDEQGHVIGEYDANGDPIQEHIYLNDRPVAVVQNGAVNYVTTDQLNTPRAITNSSQQEVWSWNSDPFGNGTPSGSLTYNMRLPGQYYDAETGHNYNYAREYDPATGRYIESDPIGLNGGINTYAYVVNNPLRWVDPTGNQIDWGGYVINNPWVVNDFISLNYNLVWHGFENDCFTLKVTGGDRYRGDDGNIYSSTTDEVIPTADPHSPHLEERGARAIDFVVVNNKKCGCKPVSNADVDAALKGTLFSPANTARDYPDAPHTHIALPPGPAFSYSPPTN